MITKVIGNNAIKLELPNRIKIHDVVHASNTTPHKDQPTDVAAPVQLRPEPMHMDDGE